MTHDQIINDLKNKIYRPVYLLTGEEPYYIDKITDYISDHVLEEQERAFNQVVLYGRETDPDSIIEHARRFPMMSDYQVVIIKEAQQMRKIEALQAYVENPTETTILVVCYKYKKLDKRKTITKAFAKHAFFESKKLYENKIPDWISAYLREKGLSIHPRAALLLTEYLGTDLSKISNELEKLLLNVEKGTEINTDHVEQNIGISKEFNTFELQTALGKRDVVKANRIAIHFSKNPKAHPFVVTISSLYTYFSKILSYHYLKDKSEKNVASTLRVHPFFVREYAQAAQHFNAHKTVDIIGYLREFDLKSKGVGNTSSSDGDLLREMVYRILH